MLVAIRIETPRSQGFTVVEILITVCLMALVFAVSVPYSAAWVESARVQSAEDMLEQAVKVAKSEALRNPLATVGTAPAAGVRIQTESAPGVPLPNEVLLVCQGDPTSADCEMDGDNEVWRSELPDGVQVNVNGAALTALRIDNSGGFVSGAGNVLAASYSISKGGESENGDLY